MAVEAGTQPTERVTGRVWTVRLDPHGRPSAGVVRLSCSRPACADQCCPAGAGRKSAIGHVNTHLAHIREGGGPRGEAWCACRAADCAWHTPGPGTARGGGTRPPAGAARCGGPVVLTVCADRAGRLWRIAEMCARCAAATPDCRVLDTAAPPARPATATTGPASGKQGAEPEPPAGPVADMAAAFSDHGPSPTVGASSAASPPAVPRARAASPGRSSQPAERRKRRGKIAQRIVPHDLEPDVLRLELIDLGDAFRAYQQSAEPDLALLAGLHERKARAFALWADVSGDGSLRQEAERAEKAAQTTRETYEARVGPLADGPAVERLLTPGQAAHARAVLDHVAAHAPHPETEVRLAVLMLTLRAARAGTGNVTGQDLSGWLQGDAEDVVQRLAAADWLRLPGTVAELMASRPEDPVAYTVPTLLPDQPRPFSFGKTTRSKISGWAQKIVGDRKIRKKKLGATARLLALYAAAHARPDGGLGNAEGGGLHLDRVAAFCSLSADQVAEHAESLVAAGWFSEAGTAEGRLRGRLADRALPHSGLLAHPGGGSSG